MGKRSPLISIIIATKNADKTLNRCLDSIIEQDYKNFEVIIVDGASIDNTNKIIYKYINYLSWYESKKDNGIYHAWNKALKKAKGDWICFLGADDYLFDKKVLQKSLVYLDKAIKNNIKLVYGNAIVINNNGKFIKKIGKSWNKIHWQIFHGMPIQLPHPMLFHHNSIFKALGYFDSEFKIAGDYDLLLRLLKNKKENCLYISKVSTVYIQNQGISCSSKLEVLKEVYKARKKNGLNFSLIWFIVYVRAMIKTLI